MNDTSKTGYSLKPLLVSQFFGAFNDNAWKLIVMAIGLNLIARQSLSGTGFLKEMEVATFAFVIFNVPMILFSLPAGALADRISKRSILVAVKALEVVLMIGGLCLLVLAPNNDVLLLGVLGLMGMQSALFSPAKYGILPELLPHERLSAGNGLVELWTMLAIIAGTGLGTLLLATDPVTGVEQAYVIAQGLGAQALTPVAGPMAPSVQLLIASKVAELDGLAPKTGIIVQPWIAGIPLVLLAFVGLAASFCIARVPAAAKGAGRGIVETVRVGWEVMRGDRIVWLTVVGMVIYWFLVSMLGQNLIVYSNMTAPPELRAKLVGVPLAIFGLGVGLGAFAAGRLSGEKVEYGIIPLGAIIFSVFTFALSGAIIFRVFTATLSLAHPEFWGTLIFMPFLGIACGLIAVPLNAILQWRAPADRRGAVISLSNVFVLIGTAAGSIGAYGLALAHFPPAWIFLAGAVAVLAATIWSVYLMPEAFLRLILFLLTHTFYRIKVVGTENVPQTGGVLLTPNHVSFVDGLLIMASLDRPVRFIVYEGFVNSWWLRPIMRTLRTIPISSSGGPKMILRAMRDAGEHLEKGEVVCVFPEGQLTRTGMLLPFRRGIERIIKGRKAEIVPVYLDRVWGSIFSHAGGKVFWKLPKEIPYGVEVRFGEPLPAETTQREVRRAVHELSEAAWRERMVDRPPLQRTLIKALRKRRFAFSFGDERRPRVSRIGALTGTIALAKALQPDWQDQPHVGILLPPSVVAALVNFAATMSGRTSVNLNYTVGQAGLESAAKQAELKTVVTSQTFLKKAKVELPDNVRPIWIEEVAKRVTVGGKLSAMLLANFGFKRQIELACGATKPILLDDVVTIIFSSGSTGEPKGVQLTHANIDANVEGCAQVFPLERDDRALGILPFFHSFGYMTTWLAVNHGVGGFFHANPLDANGIGALVEKHRLTILIATPTFLQLYLKRVSPGQFGSLRFVLTGAEKLSPRLAEAFRETFGIRPIEGYGATECSPVISVSTLDYRGRGVFQSGSRVGSVGHPLPGTALKLVDPDTYEPLPTDDGDVIGLLMVKGPNVMLGYLGKTDLTAKVVRDGWYDTGDMAQIDEDGFVRITGRLSRFSKIGGEMVPHERVEEALQEAANADFQVFAVTAVADEKKGERLIVLHTIDEGRISGILEKVGDSGLPNLFIPRADQFIKVDELPLLGTGKLDLRAVKRIAEERAAGI